MVDSYKEELEFSNVDHLKMILGNHNQNIAYLEEKFHVDIYAQDTVLVVNGNHEENSKTVITILRALRHLMQIGIKVSLQDVVIACKMVQKGTLEYIDDLYNKVIFKTNSGKEIKAKTFGQKQYVEAITKKDIVFGIGPAGTGKTFLAVVMAAKALKEGKVKRIILTRPAVEAGENLGFLPGDLKEKIDPYLRPLYDALYYVFGQDHTNRLMERGIIEVAPLAYMRGRTLDDAFVILDEAQNTTREQMKMFLTRLGFNSKLVVNGDKTQIDLPKGSHSGLIDAEHKLKEITDIYFNYFEATDVVRHPLVAQIIAAYEQ